MKEKKKKEKKLQVLTVMDLAKQGTYSETCLKWPPKNR